MLHLPAERSVRGLISPRPIAVSMTAEIKKTKIYDDAKMRPVRESLESAVLAWPGASRRSMMGCLVYFRGKRFFAFLVNDGLVVTKFSEEEAVELAKRPGAKPFEMSGRTTKFVQLRASKPADVKPLLPYVRASYEASR